jgi:hypothetical protein
MVFEPEEGAEIDADDVIGDVRAAIAPICHWDFGFVQRHDRAVDIGGSRTPIDACRVGKFNRLDHIVGHLNHAFEVNSGPEAAARI